MRGFGRSPYVRGGGGGGVYRRRDKEALWSEVVEVVVGLFPGGVSIPNVYCRPSFPKLVKKKPYCVTRDSLGNALSFVLINQDFVVYLDVGRNLVKIEKSLHIHQRLSDITIHRAKEIQWHRQLE